MDMLDEINGGAGGGIYVSEDTAMKSGAISGSGFEESESVCCPECGGVLDLRKNRGNEIKHLICPHCKKYTTVFI